MRLEGGQKIGAVGLAIEAGELESRPVWRMLVRRFITGGLNQGVSRVVVDRETMRPRRTEWDHTILGAANAVWDNQKVVITKGKGSDQSETSVDLDGLAYSNDQTFYSLRMLPLEVDYKTTIPLRVAFTGGNPVGFEVSVSKKEQIETPAGTFDCFRLETNIAQTFWVADNPERYLVRFDAGGVVAELSSIEHDGDQRLENTELFFSITLPDGWFSYAGSSSNDATSAGFHLVSPDMGFATLQVRKKSLLDAEERQSARAWAEAKIQSLKDRVKSVEVVADVTDAPEEGAEAVGG